MFKNWLINLNIAIIFFVLGQIILRIDKNDIITKSSSFFIIGGILGLIVLLFNTLIPS